MMTINKENNYFDFLCWLLCNQHCRTKNNEPKIPLVIEKWVAHRSINSFYLFMIIKKNDMLALIMFCDNNLTGTVWC